MRKLTVDFASVPLTDIDAAQLEKHGVIYLCGDPTCQHDYHINPEDATPYGTEDLIQAISRGFEETLADQTQVITMGAQMNETVIRFMEPEVYEKRKTLLKRNVAINMANYLLNHDLIHWDEKKDALGNQTFNASLTVLKPTI